MVDDAAMRRERVNLIAELLNFALTLFSATQTRTRLWMIKVALLVDAGYPLQIEAKARLAAAHIRSIAILSLLAVN